MVSPAILAQVALVAALTGLGSRVVVFLPGNPVPMTMQVLPVLLAGVLLGARRGAAAQVAYLAAIATGLPIDARQAGPLAFAGPTAGYLIGFVVAAATAGWVRQRLPDRAPAYAVAALAGLAALYLCGTAWLAVYLGGDATTAWRLGVAPFLPADLAKAALCALLAASPPLRRIGARLRARR
jgi:biotin transport system substrate-specific component